MIDRCKFIHNLPCEQVSERITELEDENARLRSCLSDDAENARQIMGENAKLRELLSMYMTFARTVARGLSIQSAYADGMGRKLDEVEMMERAMELGIERCR